MSGLMYTNIMTKKNLARQGVYDAKSIIPDNFDTYLALLIYSKAL